MKKLVVHFISCIAAFILLSSCGGIIRSYIAKDEANVPTDFAKKNEVVLIVKWKKAYNKELENDFSKYYKGEYILIEEDEINTLYKDINKYRYIFSSKVFITKYRDAVSGMGAGSSGSLLAKLTDRATDKGYDSGVTSGVSWKAIVRAYIQKLEKVRAGNHAK